MRCVCEQLVRPTHAGARHKRTKFEVTSGDFNEWALDWGNRKNNAKGRNLLGFAQLDIVLAKEGNVSVFQKGWFASTVDLTFISPAVKRCMTWHVIKDYIHSDHLAIIFELRKQSHGRQIIYLKPRGTSGWCAKTLDE